MQGFQRIHHNWVYGSSGLNGGRKFLSGSASRPLMKTHARASAFVLFSVVLFAGAFFSTRLLRAPSFPSDSGLASIISTKGSEVPKKPRKKIEIPLNCSSPSPAPSVVADGAASANLTDPLPPPPPTCPANYYPSNFHPEPDGVQDDPPSCPEYFRWIHEDLRPWQHTGITREMVERARKTATFRLVIVGGRAYVERFHKGFQSRDDYTLWGILQVLRRYPGKIPNLELMFDCVDWPVVIANEYRGPNATAPPPLFRYCADDSTLDIVFPDWSFWGWPEINIKPWGLLLKELKEGNARIKWVQREPYAYWKGNPHVAATREELLKCNVSEQYDWGARVYAQNWIKELNEGFKQSDLSRQCHHRYKIYIEGSAWSVSEKYILACDSVTFIVNPRYYDFFTRGLMPVHNYWPIRDDDKCRSIKFAVHWGNAHKRKAQLIGKAASSFIQEDLKMEFVYDYMFHLLSQYARLLKFQPVVPLNATELCSEAMACSARGVDKEFKLKSLVKGPADGGPCKMPPPFDPPSLYAHKRRKENSMRQVEMWEAKYWENRTQQQMRVF